MRFSVIVLGILMAGCGNGDSHVNECSNAPSCTIQSSGDNSTATNGSPQPHGAPAGMDDVAPRADVELCSTNPIIAIASDGQPLSSPYAIGCSRMNVKVCVENAGNADANGATLDVWISDQPRTHLEVGALPARSGRRYVSVFDVAVPCATAGGEAVSVNLYDERGFVVRNEALPVEMVWCHNDAADPGSLCANFGANGSGVAGGTNIRCSVVGTPGTTDSTDPSMVARDPRCAGVAFPTTEELRAPDGSDAVLHVEWTVTPSGERTITVLQFESPIGPSGEKEAIRFSRMLRFIVDQDTPTLYPAFPLADRGPVLPGEAKNLLLDERLVLPTGTVLAVDALMSESQTNTMLHGAADFSAASGSIDIALGIGCRFLR